MNNCVIQCSNALSYILTRLACINFGKKGNVKFSIENAPLWPISKGPRGALHKKVNKGPLGRPYYPPYPSPSKIAG